MTGIGENTLAQPVKPPLRERRACLAKLVKNRLTLTYRDWEGVTAEEFMGRLEAYLVYYRDGRIKKSLEWLSPMEYRRKLGYA